MISRLYNDHNRILKILNLLEIQLIGLCRKKTTDYQVMHTLVVYLQEYPEKAHHPLEDELYSMIIKSGVVDENDFVKDLIKDHTEIEEVTRDLREIIEDDLYGKSENMDHLIKKLSNFISKQRKHLLTEEMTLFPLIESRVALRDYELVEARYAIADNSVGMRTDQDYESLERKLESMVK